MPRERPQPGPAEGLKQPKPREQPTKGPADVHALQQPRGWPSQGSADGQASMCPRPPEEKVTGNVERAITRKVEANEAEKEPHGRPWHGGPADEPPRERPHPRSADEPHTTPATPDEMSQERLNKGLDEDSKQLQQMPGEPTQPTTVPMGEPIDEPIKCTHQGRI